MKNPNEQPPPVTVPSQEQPSESVPGNALDGAQENLELQSDGKTDVSETDLEAEQAIAEAREQLEQGVEAIAAEIDELTALELNEEQAKYAQGIIKQELKKMTRGARRTLSAIWTGGMVGTTIVTAPIPAVGLFTFLGLQSANLLLASSVAKLEEWYVTRKHMPDARDEAARRVKELRELRESVAA